MERDIDQINVIPLVDVMLVLLVIILTTASFIVTGQVPVDLADAQAANAPPPEDPLRLTLTAEGKLFLGETPIAVAQLGEALSAYPKERLIVLQADRTLVLETFVKVVDGLKRQGFPHVSLEVERAESAS